MSKGLFLRAAMAMAVASASNGYGKIRHCIETKSTDEIIEDRRNRGLKSSYVEKAVKPYAGKKKISRKKRKNENNN
ncbi:MAG: hypothetical protein LBL58_13900 [Tannerellaceae bacterium]|jgi:hypothetical protein|nr:hypothetical protein [Tannerellaceae bacterium]